MQYMIQVSYKMSNSFPLPISVSHVHLLCNMKQSDTNPSFPKDTSISVLPLAKESTEQPLHSLCKVYELQPCQLQSNQLSPAKISPLVVFDTTRNKLTNF